LTNLLLPAIAFPLAISLLLTALLLRWAPRLGLVDLPGARKVHSRPVPRGGGLAIYAAVALSAYLLHILDARSLTCGPKFLAEQTLCLGLGGVIVLLGLIDDLRPLPWQLRLGVQTAAAVVVVASWLQAQGWLLQAAAVVWIVGLVNAFNMLDNMDALSAGVAWFAAAGFAAYASRNAAAVCGDLDILFVLLMGATTGFLWFNRPPARIFMGDAGSTFLGFYLGVLSLIFVRRGGPGSWAVPLCVLAVPWYDLITVVTLRLWQGHSPFHADKQHLSHRLVALGLSSPDALLSIYFLAAVSMGAGMLINELPEATVWVAGGLLVVWLAVAAIEYVRHFRRG
jgi:UDP-GlcNAc:undecaprenyl-phosphate GlcNAc-1-phosphate transferase